MARAENADDARSAGPKAEGALGMILADLARSEAHASSSQLVYALHGSLVERTGGRDRGVRQAPFAVLEGAAMPAVLLEVGYISHGAEAQRLDDAAKGVEGGAHFGIARWRGRGSDRHHGIVAHQPPRDIVRYMGSHTS